MSELTKEQIEAFARSPHPALAVGDQEALCALALEALNARAELATLRKDAALGAAWRGLGEYGPFLIESAIDAIDNGCGFEDDARDRVRTFRDVSNAALREEGR